MSLTLGLTGMDPATEAALKAAFTDANARLNGHWQLAAENDADHVLVDMDSMYGPMSWLRLHAAGKRVIGLTSAPRAQTDFRLGRPFDGQQMGELLQQIARDSGVDLSPRAAAPSAPTPAPAPPAPTPPPSEPVATPVAAAVLEPEPQSAPEPESIAPAATPAAASSARDALPEPATSDSAPLPPAAPVRRDPVFGDWLQPGAMTGRARYRRGDGPTLLVDFDHRHYHGPAALKPLAEYLEGPVQIADFKPVDDKAWAVDAAALGEAQPLARLQWLAGLVAGHGALLPGFDPEGRFQLNKWPQTEREFPRHFRIATAMMKGPATLAEIAAASGIPHADVVDFVNANLATGFAEFVPEPPPAPLEPPKPSGLLGRLRGK